MVFTGLNILYYLLNRKTEFSEFINSEKFVKGLYFIQERGKSIRNFSFRVFELNEQDFIDKSLFFIKQVRAFDKINLLDIDTEARALRLLNNNCVMKEFTPTLLDSDFYNGCIVMNHIDGKLLQEFLAGNYRFIGFNVGVEAEWEIVFTKISTILSTLHRESIEQNFLEYTPEVLQITKEFINNISKIRELRDGFVINQNLPNKTTIKYLTNILPLLAKIEYNKDSLIHRDAHFENFIINKPEVNSIILKLVDWELMRIGDRYLDIAKIYSCFLNLNTDPNNPKKLDFMNKIAKFIWDEYHKTLKINIGNKSTVLKVVNFILWDSLERELDKMIAGELLDDNKIKEIYKSLINPENFSINGINLYKVLTTP